MLLCISIPERNHAKQPKNLTDTAKCLSKLDIPGFILFAPAAVMLLIALQWGGSQYAWNSATIIGLFCGAGVMAIIFLAWEYYIGDEAMIPFSMLKRRNIWSSLVFIWLLFGSMMVFSYYLPIYFQAVKGASALSSGVDILPLILSQLITAMASGGLGEIMKKQYISR